MDNISLTPTQYSEMQQQIRELKQEVAGLKLQALESRFENFHPFDAKYHEKLEPLVPYLSMAAEVRGFVRVQGALLEGLNHFSICRKDHVQEVYDAADKISPALVYELEGKVTRHDQQAVLLGLRGDKEALTPDSKEREKYKKISQVLLPHLKGLVSKEAADMLHPGTTSYDIVDTARALLYKEAILDVILPQAYKTLEAYAKAAEDFKTIPQVGRTHLQFTSPTTFGYVMATYAERLVKTIHQLTETANALEGKISGIVGTGASIGLFVGNDRIVEFERYVLDDVLKLKVPLSSSQIGRREQIMNVGHHANLVHCVLADTANDFRHLARSEVAEVAEGVSLRNLGGSSTDAGKSNPIMSENICGLWASTVPGVMALYHMGISEHQRDLRNSVMERIEPRMGLLGVYLSLQNMEKVLNELVVFDDRMMENLLGSSKYGTAECMTNLFKAHGEPEGHEIVRELSKGVRAHNRKAETGEGAEMNLVEYAFANEPRFKTMFDTQLTEEQQNNLTRLSTFVGSAVERTDNVLEFINSLRN